VLERSRPCGLGSAYIEAESITDRQRKNENVAIVHGKGMARRLVMKTKTWAHRTLQLETVGKGDAVRPAEPMATSSAICTPAKCV
jgi:hypothetical protein